MKPIVIIHDAGKKKWFSFENPVAIFKTSKIDEVLEQLERIEKRVENENLHAAGFISYEASPAFDRALKTYAPDHFPLLWFGLFENAKTVKIERFNHSNNKNNWQPLFSRAEYHDIIEEIKIQLREGNTYQVNYTFPLKTEFNEDAWAFFTNLIYNQTSDYGAYIEFDNYVIASVSPEQFFILNGNTISSLPMKGTAPRGRFLAEDLEFRDNLHNSPKDRAENIMIVDMIRNDFGRIAEYGSVKVSDLYRIEKYPSVWQMVSKVMAKTDKSIAEIFEALFPCASITGAPKVNTMKIINKLEKEPRRIYTGSIGFIAPNRKVQFNVAIRTVLIDKNKHQAEYGVGGGIVWDSVNEKEYDECFIKARALTQQMPEFRLLESILWTSDQGYFILDYHFKRLKESAEYFEFQFDQQHIMGRLKALVKTLRLNAYKVRLLLSKNGSVEIQPTQLNMENNAKPLKVRLAKNPVNSNDIFLFHKTTNRSVYDRAREESPDCDEIILFNETEEITELTNANIVVKINGKLYTPPVKCGLLAGTYRQYLLDRKEITEKPILLKSFKQHENIYLINSVRRMIRVHLQS
ncbi:MAG: aminodeoxychorismate synthase component I [Calditrichaceae bacterium]|nr:aminodeoxychorismate synthase component I [Calditrichaceae bacterium]